MNMLAIDGGQKACDVAWPRWPVWDDAERQALLGVLESGAWWFGERVREFERKFADFQGAGFGVTATSGTTALETALLALGIGAGDEVIVPPYTFMATASAVLRVNAVPVFADIQPDTLCIDPDDVERKVTPHTKAVIPVHLGGRVADMDRLLPVARRQGLRVVEDACHSWGSQWKGKGAGALGTCGVFSFQASKNITSAEGGIVLTDDGELAERCRSITNCGRRPGEAWYRHFVLGSNLRLTEFQAALLLAQLTRLEAQTLARQSNADILTEGLRGIPGIVTIENDPRMTRRGYHLYCFRLDLPKLGVDRERFIQALSAEGVPVTAGYDTPLYRNPMFGRAEDGPRGCPGSCPYHGGSIDYETARCPVCEQVCEDTCWIFHSVLLAEPKAMHAIVDAVRKVCGHLGKKGTHGNAQGSRRPG
jgi:dTDP-4-amino-4,6-dideoxygalactose transaminase